MAAAARLSPGDPAPDFTLPAGDGSTVSLADLRGSRVVLYVYPAAMTPGCTTQAGDFRDDLSVFTGAGYRVLGLSPDPPARLAAFRAAEGLTFPLLSDPGTQVHRLRRARPEAAVRQDRRRGHSGVPPHSRPSVRHSLRRGNCALRTLGCVEPTRSTDRR